MTPLVNLSEDVKLLVTRLQDKARQLQEDAAKKKETEKKEKMERLNEVLSAAARTIKNGSNKDIIIAQLNGVAAAIKESVLDENEKKNVVNYDTKLKESNISKFTCALKGIKENSLQDSVRTLITNVNAKLAAIGRKRTNRIKITKNKGNKI